MKEGLVVVEVEGEGEGWEGGEGLLGIGERKDFFVQGLFLGLVLVILMRLLIIYLFCHKKINKKL